MRFLRVKFKQTLIIILEKTAPPELPEGLLFDLTRAHRLPSSGRRRLEGAYFTTTL